MVITKHFAIHGKNYRSKLIKYILNPSKTKKPNTSFRFWNEKLFRFS